MHFTKVRGLAFLELQYSPLACSNDILQTFLLGLIALTAAVAASPVAVPEGHPDYAGNDASITVIGTPEGPQETPVDLAR